MGAPKEPQGFRITRGVNALRRWMSGFLLTRWLIGGPEGQASHTMRQGLLASLMIMVGSWGAGWIPMHAAVAVHPAVLPLRTTDEGAITSAILLVIGALLLMRSWLRLVQRIDIRGPRAVPAMRKALIMWSAPMLLCLPIFSRDVYSYMAQGRVLHAGLNPYESGVSELPGWYAEGADGLWAESPSPYGPLFLIIAQTVWYATDGSPELGILAFRALSVLGVILMVTYIPKLASAFGARPAWAIWLCLLNPLSLIVFIPAAHNDPLMIGLVLASAWYALRRRRLAAVLLITAAVAVKPIAMVLLPFIVLLALPDTRSYLLRIREWAFGGGLSGALLIGGGLALGVGLGWFTAALSAGSAVMQAAPVGLTGIGIGELAALMSDLDSDAVAVTVYDLARLLSALVLAAILLKPRLGNPMLWSAYGLTVVVLASSVIQPWYLLWLLPLYAVVHSYRGRVMTGIILLITVVVLLAIVGQLSVPQWMDQWAVRGAAGGVGALYLVYLAVFDPSTSRMFTFRHRSERWNAADGWLKLRELSTPETSWRAADIHQGTSEQKAST